MFFQLAAVGTYIPVISIYFKDYLGFSAIQAGIILSLTSLPSVLAPFLSAWIVDRLITSRRFLALCHVGAAILISVLSFEKGYYPVLITYFIYTMMLVPTYALVNAVVFHYMDDRNSFGLIRVWGSIGWVVSGWLISFFWKFTNSSDMSLALKLSALFSVIVVVLTLKLPRLKLDRDKKVTLIPHEAIDVIKKPEVTFLFILIFIMATVDKFISYGMPMFLTSNGTPRDNVMIILSLGQFPEIIMLFVLSSFIRKLGFKNIFIIALILQIARYTIFYINGPLPLTLVGITIHGFIYAFLYAGSTIYLDNFTDINSRGGVHQLFSLIYVGIAGFLGNLFAGYIAENVMANGNIDFKLFWGIPAVTSTVTLVILILRMKRLDKKELLKVI